MGNCMSQRSNEEPLEKKSHLPRLSTDSQSIDGSSISAPNPYYNASLAKRILGTKLMAKLQSSRKTGITKHNSNNQFSSNSSIMESSLGSPGSQTNLVNRSGRATSAAVRPANAGQYHLSDVLFDPVGFEFLYKFSKKEYSHENLDLFKVLLTINCEDMQAKTNSVSHLLYKKKQDERNITENEKFIDDMEKVEEEYLSSGSDYEMNIGFCTFAVLSKRRKGGIEEFASTITPITDSNCQDTATTVTTMTELTEKSTVDSSTTTSSTAPPAEGEVSSEQIVIEEEPTMQAPSTESLAITTPTNTTTETNKVEILKIPLEMATLNYYKALHKAMLDDCMGNLHDVFVRFMDSREFDQFLESHLQSSISNPSLLLNNK